MIKEQMQVFVFILITFGPVFGNNDESKSTLQYKTPSLASPSIYFNEHFDLIDQYNKKWVKSKAKKSQSDGSVVSYDGFWEIEQPLNNPLPHDFGLVLKSKAKHAAISSKLLRPYKFQTSDLVVQYEVTFQDGQECGGAYIKLLSDPGGETDLFAFYDLTPYTIMFGPDKCGNDHKLHFIFRHKNPNNGTMEEKHCKKPNTKLDEFFSDTKPHLYTLILKPDNTFKILVDHNLVNHGSLLEDFTPPVNPPAEIDDPTDVRPADWDDRDKIPDPTAKKPEDWDEDAPETIPDFSAVKPEGWLDDEPVDIKDPVAEKPKDWDEEMDGEWEAPLISNPACQEAPGCGPWSPPQIPNPDYKGKWFAPLIDNPNYKGKWSPRKIPNPDYFEDKHPFRMTSIVAVGFELWSMSPNILFDNIIITDSEETANEWASLTFDIKKSLDKNEDSLFNRFVNYTNQKPYLWAVYIVLLLIPTVLAVLFCFGTAGKDKEQDAAAKKKKTDEPQPDDEIPSENDNILTDEKIDESPKEDDENIDAEADDSLSEDARDNEAPPLSSGEKSPRRRRVRAD